MPRCIALVRKERGIWLKPRQRQHLSFRAIGLVSIGLELKRWLPTYPLEPGVQINPNHQPKPTLCQKMSLVLFSGWFPFRQAQGFKPATDVRVQRSAGDACSIEKQSNCSKLNLCTGISGCFPHLARPLAHWRFKEEEKELRS